MKKRKRADFKNIQSFRLSELFRGSFKNIAEQNQLALDELFFSKPKLKKAK